MFGLRSRLPVSDEERQWVDRAFARLSALLGESRMLEAEVILPIPKHFPDPYDATEDTVGRLFLRICEYMGVDRGRIDLEVFPDSTTHLREILPFWQAKSTGCAGLYTRTSDHSRMVVAVSILGNPAALDRIRAFCDAHDLIMFEDNCESLGASLNGRLCGTFGDINTFSTFYSHHISTMEGGLLVTNDVEIDHLARAIRNHGWARDVPADSIVNQGQQHDDPFFEAYRFVVPGYNVRPLELAGVVGIEQLKKLDGMLRVRRRNAAHFVELFRGDDRFVIQRENGESSWFSFTIILNPESTLDRARVMDAMRNGGIEFRMITGGCFPNHAAVKFFDYDIVGNLNHAKLAHERGFFVGNHPRDITAELDLLRSVLDGV